jgi:UTP--glucose-1-phosphate uridylyltransferase
LLIVEEALEAGMEKVVIVVQEQDQDEFQAFFNEQITIENFNKLPPQFQDYARRILEMGRHVAFELQPAQEGFGHAVYCSRDAVSTQEQRRILGPTQSEPFLLMLGDHLYRSDSGKSCTQQLLDAYQKYGVNVLGLRRTPESEIANFGTVTGVWIEDNQLLNVTEFVEKPTIDYARMNLRVPGLPEGEYLTVFGLYIIHSKIFEFLEDNIRNHKRERGEFQLTSALDQLRQEEGFYGLVIDGRRFDIGLPVHYLETLQEYRE